MDPTTVVWDMDGTLLDSSHAVPQAFVQATEQLAGRRVEFDEVVAAYWRGTPEVILSFLVGRTLSADECEAYYQALDGVRVAPYPGVPQTLHALRQRDLPVAVFTGASTRAAELLLRSAGLSVDLLIGGDCVERPKPAADGMLMAAERLGVAAGQLVLVGDSALDLRAARAAGSHSAAAAWGHMYDPEEPADTVLDSPQQVLRLLPALAGE
ncbi:HAD family hydrolase [Streptomyces clavuligerus]|nr:HAD family hydrolase [Streptomyces clavuligerus]WDN57039.1 HAD family hydrolase [Streptomyces clavuligerus]